MITLVAVAFFIGLFVTLVTAAPGMKCRKCGSRKTYHFTEESRDSHIRGIMHKATCRACMTCKHEETIKSSQRFLTHEEKRMLGE